MSDEQLAALSLPELISLGKRILEEIEFRAMCLEAKEVEPADLPF